MTTIYLSIIFAWYAAISIFIMIASLLNEKPLLNATTLYFITMAAGAGLSIVTPIVFVPFVTYFILNMVFMLISSAYYFMSGEAYKWFMKAEYAVYQLLYSMFFLLYTIIVLIFR